MLINNYNQCLQSMYKLKRFGIKLELSTIKYILNKLGNPQNSFRSIHVAGTNGKGSVASTLCTIVRKAGYNTGLYTSPHIINFNERIRINGVSISNASVIELWKIVKSVKLKNRELTFFEFTTVMAFYEFYRKNVDFAIIETGMGGKQDATNVIFPILSIITNISLEHTEYLGNTIEKITKEKAGIIKPGIPIVSNITQKKALAVLEANIAKNKSELLLKRRDFKVRKNLDGTFSYFGKYNKWNNINTSLKGDHQIENAAAVLAACEVLIRKKIKIGIDHIRSGLLNNKWPGRLEIVLKKPYVILDGAHNLMAVKSLGKFINNNLNEKKITLVFGILDDKSCKNMLKVLAKFCYRVIVTKPSIKRALSIDKIKKNAKIFSNNVISIANVGDAVMYAINTSNMSDVVCITGSLYVVSEAKIRLMKHYKIATDMNVNMT